jgi:uncharacterized protein YaiI (UPF0178 family)
MLEIVYCAVILLTLIIFLRVSKYRKHHSLNKDDITAIIHKDGTTSRCKPLYVLVDADTCPDIIGYLMRITEHADNVYLHVYGVSEIDLPDGMTRGVDIGDYIGDAYDITRSNPGDNALFRMIRQCGEKRMTVHAQFDYTIAMLSNAYDDVDSLVISRDVGLLMRITTESKYLREVNICAIGDDLMVTND